MSTPNLVSTGVRERVDALDWDGLREQLDGQGHAITVPLLDADECAALSDLFDGGRFRTTIDMARHRFGDGRYRYLDHPLPATIAALRTSFYRHHDHLRAADRDGRHLPRLPGIPRRQCA